MLIIVFVCCYSSSSDEAAPEAGAQRRLGAAGARPGSAGGRGGRGPGALLAGTTGAIAGESNVLLLLVFYSDDFRLLGTLYAIPRYCLQSLYQWALSLSFFPLCMWEPWANARDISMEWLRKQCNNTSHRIFWYPKYKNTYFMFTEGRAADFAALTRRGGFIWAIGYNWCQKEMFCYFVINFTKKSEIWVFIS